MNYLDYINSAPIYQDGGSTPNPWKELAKDLTPGLGTYRAYQRAKENPGFWSYADLGMSAVGDIATLTGTGALIKGASALNKANKARKAATAATKTGWEMSRRGYHDLARESYDLAKNKLLSKNASETLANIYGREGLFKVGAGTVVNSIPAEEQFRDSTEK